MQPTLTVNNVQKTGPAGADRLPLRSVAPLRRSAACSAVATAAEQGGGTTSTTINANLGNGNYFWRVQASDPSNAITTAYSSVSPFTVQLFNLAESEHLGQPAPTSRAGPRRRRSPAVDFTDDAILVDFDRRDGPDRWPDVGFGSGALEYTLGMCVNIQGTWNCSATVQFWHGRDLEASGPPGDIAAQLVVRPRWGALLGYQPSCGETVGIYVGAGNLRDSGNVIAKERSNIVLMPFCGAYRAGVGVLSAARKIEVAARMRYRPTRDPIGRGRRRDARTRIASRPRDRANFYPLNTRARDLLVIYSWPLRTRTDGSSMNCRVSAVIAASSPSCCWPPRAARTAPPSPTATGAAAPSMRR